MKDLLLWAKNKIYSHSISKFLCSHQIFVNWSFSIKISFGELQVTWSILLKVYSSMFFGNESKHKWELHKAWRTAFDIQVQIGLSFE